MHRPWAPVRFHVAGSAEISDAITAQCDEVYHLQAQDSARFASASTDLFERLDASVGSVIAMTCDHRFSTLFANWAASCDHHGIDVRSSTIVFPTDGQAFDRIEALGFVAYHDPDSALVRAMSPSGSYADPAWVQYMYHQNWVIEELLGIEAGIDVLFQDVDVVWRRDPRPVLSANAANGIDVQAMYDGPNPRFQPLYANAGFMYMRNSPAVHSFWDEVYANHPMIGYYRSQQEPLNVLLAAHAHRGLEVLVLDEDRFANGHLYSGSRTAPADPWVVHHSWTADLATKLERYVASDTWFLGEDELGPLQDAERAKRHAMGPASAAVPLSADDQDRPAAARDVSAEVLLELLGALRRERNELARALEAIHESTSWRLTAPLRRVADALKRRSAAR